MAQASTISSWSSSAHRMISGIGLLLGLAGVRGLMAEEMDVVDPMFMKIVEVVLDVVTFVCIHTARHKNW